MAVKEADRSGVVSDDLPLDLSEGKSWHAAVKLDQQLPADRKVIWDNGPLLGGSRFEIYLNRAEELILAVADDANVVHATPPIPVPIGRMIHLECSLIKRTAPRFSLAVFVDGVRKAKVDEFEAVFSPVQNSRLGLYHSVQGTDPAAAAIFELLQYSWSDVLVTSRAERHRYFATKHGIGWAAN